MATPKGLLSHCSLFSPQRTPQYPLISMHRLSAPLQSLSLFSASPSARETPQPPLQPKHLSSAHSLHLSVASSPQFATHTGSFEAPGGFPARPSHGPAPRFFSKSRAPPLNLRPALGGAAQHRPGPAHARREPRLAVWRQTSGSPTRWTPVSAFWFRIRIPED